MKLSVIKPLCAMIASLVMCLAFFLTLPSKSEDTLAQQAHQEMAKSSCDDLENRFHW